MSEATKSQAKEDKGGSKEEVPTKSESVSKSKDDNFIVTNAKANAPEGAAIAPKTEAVTPVVPEAKAPPKEASIEAKAPPTEASVEAKAPPAEASIEAKAPEAKSDRPAVLPETSKTIEAESKPASITGKVADPIKSSASNNKLPETQVPEPSGQTKNEENSQSSQKETNSPSEGAEATETTQKMPVEKTVSTGRVDEVKPLGKNVVKSGRRGPKEKATIDNCRIGFIGAGKIAENIIRGLLDRGVAGDRFFVATKSGKMHEAWQELGATTTKRLYDIFAKYEADVIFMATHGLVIKECFRLGGTRPMALCINFIPIRTAHYYILSLIGGIPMSDIKQVLLNPEEIDNYKYEVHRIMLNASVSRGLGIGAIDAEIDSRRVNPIVRNLLCKIAKVEFYPESQMDILCCVGGNGLAFTYYFLAALASGGFKMGLPKKTAVSLATKTLHCTALTLLESGKHPSQLRDMCASPSGPAIYGLTALEQKDCASGVSQAVEMAFKRVRELVNEPCI